MRIEDVENLLKNEAHPMTSSQIADRFCDNSTQEIKQGCRSRVSGIMSTLNKHHVVEVVAMEVNFPHRKYWYFTRD